MTEQKASRAGIVSGGTPTRRRYIWGRDGVKDREVAEKSGTRVHKAMVRVIQSEDVFSRVQVILAVAYYEDMTSFENPTLAELPPVYPEDVADVTGISRDRAAQYAGECVRQGLLKGNAKAGYRSL